MQIRFFLLLYLGLFLAGLLQNTKAQTPFRVVGFYSEDAVYRRDYLPSDVPADLLTHLHYAFAVPRDPDQNGLFEVEFAHPELAYTSYIARLVPGTDRTAQEHKGILRQLRALKRRHPHLKILLSIGGACLYNPNNAVCEPLHDRFKQIARSPESIAYFADQAVQLMTQPFPNGEDQRLFDGIDLDWEFPDAADRKTFVAVLQALRNRLNEASQRLNRPLLLTIDGAATPYFIQHYDIPAIAPLVDWVNVMAYLYHMPQSWNDHTGHHAPFRTSKKDPHGEEYNLRQVSVQAWKAGGMPLDKLMLGIPYFGVGYAGVEAGSDPKLPGLYQRYRAPLVEGGEIPYSELWTQYWQTGSYKAYWDTEAGVPFLYNERDKAWISYESPMSASGKTNWAKKEGLGGVFLWELSMESPLGQRITPITLAIAEAAANTQVWSTQINLQARAMPNPFQGSTHLVYHVSEISKVRIHVLDPAGQTVAVLLDQPNVIPGLYRIPFDASMLPTGTYTAKVRIQNQEENVRLRVQR